MHNLKSVLIGMVWVSLALNVSANEVATNAVLAQSASSATAQAPLSGALKSDLPTPQFLQGVWATHGAVLQGDVIQNGTALYFAGNGVGAMVAANERDVLGGHVLLVSYSAKMNTFAIDLVQETGEVVHHLPMTYDPVRRVIYLTADPDNYYEHKAKVVSVAMKKALALDNDQ